MCSSDLGLGVEPRARVWQLSVGEQQRVEILKALYREARVLILDEPTAVLTPQEVDELFAVLRTLREAGTTIVLITHKLAEVKALADRVTVMRAGRVVGGGAARAVPVGERDASHRPQLRHSGPRGGRQRSDVSIDREARPVGQSYAPALFERLDRKSTRLNSSH